MVKWLTGALFVFFFLPSGWVSAGEDEVLVRSQDFYAIPGHLETEDFLWRYVARLKTLLIQPTPDFVVQDLHLLAADAYHWLGHIFEEKRDFVRALELHQHSLRHYGLSGQVTSPYINYLVGVEHASWHIYFVSQHLGTDISPEILRQAAFPTQVKPGPDQVRLDLQSYREEMAKVMGFGGGLHVRILTNEIWVRSAYRIPDEVSTRDFLDELFQRFERALKNPPGELTADEVHLMYGDALHWWGHILKAQHQFAEAFLVFEKSLTQYRQSQITTSRFIQGLVGVEHASHHILLMGNTLSIPIDAATRLAGEQELQLLKIGRAPEDPDLVRQQQKAYRERLALILDPRSSCEDFLMKRGA